MEITLDLTTESYQALGGVSSRCSLGVVDPAGDDAWSPPIHPSLTMISVTSPTSSLYRSSLVCCTNH